MTAADQDDPDSTPDNDDGDQSEDDEDSATTSPQQADLSLAKSVSNSTPNVGDAVTFTITVTNQGPSNATGVAVEDYLPNGYTGITNISNGGTLSGSTITWSGLSIASGGQRQPDVRRHSGRSGHRNQLCKRSPGDGFRPGRPGQSTPDNDDGDQSEDDEDSATTSPQQADLSLAKSVSNSTPNVGDVVTFTITVTNQGPSNATGVAVEDYLPNGYSNIANISNGGTLSGSTITWSGLTVAGGSSLSLTFNATVVAPGTGVSYENVAQVTAADQDDPDSTPDNDDGDQSEDDEDSTTTTPQQADLSLAKSVSNSTPNVGDVVTFTITVTNQGPSNATGVAVEDYLPNGYSGISEHQQRRHVRRRHDHVEQPDGSRRQQPGIDLRRHRRSAGRRRQPRERSPGDGFRPGRPG
ncbi:MAG: DUF11 domain-containing protein [Lewinellaceae bacterium]|nr:DUF11 domain-containing protein [Lewinellaceae bacterium]